MQRNVLTFSTLNCFKDCKDIFTYFESYIGSGLIQVYEIISGTAIHHYNDVIMGAISSQITSLMIVYSTVYSDPDQRKHQSSASLAFVWGIHRGPVNSPHKWPMTWKMLPFDDVIMCCLSYFRSQCISRHGIDPQTRNISSPASEELTLMNRQSFYENISWQSWLRCLKKATNYYCSIKHRSSHSNLHIDENV